VSLSPTRDRLDSIRGDQARQLNEFERVRRRLKKLLAEVGEDIPKVLNILRAPTQGKLINRRFLDLKLIII
jgi:hypothetical protein